MTVLPALRDKVDENLLRVYIKEWKDYTLLTHFMRKMFYYVEKYYLNNTKVD